jgi:hypothetical protein
MKPTLNIFLTIAKPLLLQHHFRIINEDTVFVAKHDATNTTIQISTSSTKPEYVNIIFTGQFNYYACVHKTDNHDTFKRILHQFS